MKGCLVLTEKLGCYFLRGKLIFASQKTALMWQCPLPRCHSIIPVAGSILIDFVFQIKTRFNF